MTDNASQSRDDPFDLDFLASKLHSGESSPTGPPVDLPILIPLSHDHPHLTPSAHKLPFDVDEFLLTRASHTSLPDLRAELRDYLAQLKEELVGLINRDYGDFVSLGTDLRGEGERLERLGKPLEGMKAEVEKSRAELEAVKDAVKQQLSQRGALREDKALLHLLLTLSDSLIRLESLLGVPSPPSEGPDMPAIPSPVDGSPIVTSRGAKHLSRVAAEYLQMLYNADKARGEGCAFVESEQWRIDRIRSTLSRDLDNLFSSLLSPDSAPAAHGLHILTATSTIPDLSRKLPELSELLRTYDALGEWRQAEDVVRREVVRPFIRKTIHSSALAAPPSPLMPRTPFRPRFNRQSYSEGLLSPPPITPGFPGAPATPYMPTAPLLLNEDTPLAALYNQLLRFAERELNTLIETSERVNSTGRGRNVAVTAVPPAEDEMPTENRERFDFLANVFWAEISAALMDEMGGQLFAAGKPDEFLVNFRTTNSFLLSLETLCPSLTSVIALRSHPGRRIFDRRWQLPVYFQLRWKEIVGSLEEALSGQVTSQELVEFNSQQAAAVWHALQQCWSEDVFVLELGDRFWRLTLQILSRYRTWMEPSLPNEIGARVAAHLNIERSASPALSASSTRAASPMPPSTPDNPADTASDENTLRQMASSIVDLKLLEKKAWELYDHKIGGLLEEAEEGEKHEDTLEASLARLLLPVPLYTSEILSILTKRCADPLRHVRSIASQYRAMSNKREPSEPSYFVPGIMRPAKVFFDRGGPGEGLKDAYGSEWATSVFNEVCQRYTAILVDMKKTEDSLRRFKQGKKTTFSLFGSSSASAKEDEGKDEERVKKQMLLDINALAKDADALGVDTKNSGSFKALKETVGLTEQH